MTMNSIGWMGKTYNNAGTSQLTTARQQFLNDLKDSDNSQLQTDYNQQNQDKTTLLNDLKTNNPDALSAWSRVQEDGVFGASDSQTQADTTAFENLLTTSQKTEYTQLQTDSSTFQTALSGADSQTQTDYQTYQTAKNDALQTGLNSGTIDVNPYASSSNASNSNLNSSLVQILQQFMSMLGGGNSYQSYQFQPCYAFNQSNNPFINSYNNNYGYGGYNNYNYGGYNNSYNDGYYI